jgi:hypothetical protein
MQPLLQRIIIRIQTNQDQSQQQLCRGPSKPFNSRKHHAISVSCFLSLLLRNHTDHDTIDQLLSWLFLSSSSKAHENHAMEDGSCTALAMHILLGNRSSNIDGYYNIREEEIEFFIHMLVNYNEYIFHTLYSPYEEKEVMILRTESLWDDIHRLRRTYFDTDNETNIDYGIWNGYQHTHDADRYVPWTRHIENMIVDTNHYYDSNVFAVVNHTGSNDDRSINNNNIRRIVLAQLLCCTIWNEMKSYHQLVVRAMNLNHTLKETTLLRDANKCGFVTWSQLVQECESIHQ